MKPAVALSAGQVGPPSRAMVPRVLLALVPVATLGLLSPVPALVIAVRRRTASAWLVFAGFTALAAAWLVQVERTPDETHGVQFAADLVLLLACTVGAAVHCLLARSAPDREPGSRPVDLTKAGEVT
ncbi:hypothetical protein AB0903_25090 [Streptomyces sp. NPDC048389]|uniref:hypothetical protein n=1 Tax=Streptomyces sp. NPDC048389 TaxID=3154622 RepID=UPI0034552ACE